MNMYLYIIRAPRDSAQNTQAVNPTPAEWQNKPLSHCQPLKKKNDLRCFPPFTFLAFFLHYFTNVWTIFSHAEIPKKIKSFLLIDKYII